MNETDYFEKYIDLRMKYDRLKSYIRISSRKKIIFPTHLSHINFYELIDNEIRNDLIEHIKENIIISESDNDLGKLRTAKIFLLNASLENEGEILSLLKE